MNMWPTPWLGETVSKDVRCSGAVCGLRAENCHPGLFGLSVISVNFCVFLIEVCPFSAKYIACTGRPPPPPKLLEGAGPHPFPLTLCLAKQSASQSFAEPVICKCHCTLAKRESS